MGLVNENMSDKIKIIGIDCAAQPMKMGLAIGLLKNATVTVESVQYGLSDPPKFVADAMQTSMPVLLALDAPLGWPAPMGAALAMHNAAEQVSISPNALFRRDTDRFVKKSIGKQPLDVGADRIARTAWSAVNLLAEIRQLTGEGIPLAWNNDRISDWFCIEVYPAATLEAYGLSSRGYKGKKTEHQAAREKLIFNLGVSLTMSDDVKSKMVSNDDAFDSVICLLAAADFLRGNSMQPENMDTARKEGWIWVRGKRDSGCS